MPNGYFLILLDRTTDMAMKFGKKAGYFRLFSTKCFYKDCTARCKKCFVLFSSTTRALLITEEPEFLFTVTS